MLPFFLPPPTAGLRPNISCPCSRPAWRRPLALGESAARRYSLAAEARRPGLPPSWASSRPQAGSPQPFAAALNTQAQGCLAAQTCAFAPPAVGSFLRPGPCPSLAPRGRAQGTSVRVPAPGPPDTHSDGAARLRWRAPRPGLPQEPGAACHARVAPHTLGKRAGETGHHATSPARGARPAPPGPTTTRGTARARPAPPGCCRCDWPPAGGGPNKKK